MKIAACCTVVGALVAGLGPCSKSSDAVPSGSAATSAVVSSTPTKAFPAPSPEAWCKFVFEVNRKHDYMVGNQYRLKPPPGSEKAITLEAISRKSEYIAIAPADIQADVKSQMEFFERVAAWGNANAWQHGAKGAPVPTQAELAAQTRLFDYQVKHCGLNPAPLH